jgi:hypothetical protein
MMDRHRVQRLCLHQEAGVIAHNRNKKCRYRDRGTDWDSFGLSTMRQGIFISSATTGDVSTIKRNHQCHDGTVIP